MKTYKIAVGTTYEQKILFLKETLEEIGVMAEVLPTKVESGVSDQPVSEKETLTGSINRAKQALSNNPEADYAIGIEVGYNLNSNNKYEMFCSATIADREGFLETCFSSRFLLPNYHQNILKKKLYLGDFVRQYSEDKTDPITNYIRDFIIYRKFLIKEAVRNILLRYLKQEEFQI